MPEVLVRADDQRRLLVVVEGAQAQVVLAVFLQRDAGGLHQAQQGDLGFQPLDLRLGDPGHGLSPQIAAKTHA